MEFFSGPYQIYTIAVLFVFSLALIEVLLFFIGVSASSIFENADLDLDLDLDGDLDVDFNFDSASPDNFEIEVFSSSGVLAPASFFNIGKIPFFIILMTLGLTFGLFGIFLTKMMAGMGIDLSPVLSIPLSVMFSAISTWGITNLLAKVLPGEETYAISSESFLGREAEVEDGIATSKMGAMVSFVDEYNIRHKFLGVVALDDIEIKKGEKVVILRKNGERGGFYILPSFEKLLEKNQEAKEKEEQKTKEMVMDMT